MFKKSLSFALLAVAALSHADVLYDNLRVSGSKLFTSGFNRVADDFQFGAAGSTYNPAATITGFNLGYSVDNVNATESFDMVVNFYQDMDITTSTGTGPMLTGLAKSYKFGFDNVVGGFNYQTGLLNLANFGGAFTLPAISDFSTREHGVEVLFYNRGTTTLNNNVTVLFKGSPIPATGYSYDIYGRDANGDGTISTGERSFFNGTNVRANFEMQIQGTAVPEPSAFAALGLGAVAVLRRRKRA